MVGALWTGISGLSGAQTALDNESNNIANVNTVGYKASRISFADQMYQDHIGKGVSSYAVEKLYTQGNLKVTGVSYDMALSGDGFFLVNDGSQDYFTRAGNFRMGDPGNLQTAGGLGVQGWAMQPLQDEDIEGSDNNAKQFTNDYSKLLGNQIVQGDNNIKTITAKATDYTKTAISDDMDLYAGAGPKTASTKISDVELLVTKYNQELLTYANTNPKPTATESKVQRDMVDFNFTADTYTAGVQDAATKDLDIGDEIYAWVDGIKYSQSFDTDDQTTMELLVNKLSNIPGINAYITDGDTTNDATLSKEPYQLNTQDTTGKVVIESLIPGQQIRVTEIGIVDASAGNAVTKGSLSTFQEAVQGTGLGAIASAQKAMSEAISGKQQDVYTPTKLTGKDASGNSVAATDLQYSISIYDKTLQKDIMIPNDGLDDTTAIPLSLGATSSPATSAEVDAIVALINANDLTDDNELSDYVKAYNINGNLVIKTKDENYDIEYTSDMKDIGGAVTPLDVPRNPNLSGREGAAAECLAITTTINQTATKSDLQLRLDTLGITDSAFGEFSVDSSGIITMKQDGADYAIGQVAIAKFTDNRGLEPAGDNLVIESNRSGKAMYNLNNDKTADLRGGTLELSNSDLSESLVNLMVFQRAFEANSKTISTSDQILTTLIQLKR
ncbi:MAG: flagellar hook-basal body complex protein [Campylobacterota bacterium]|nr:flagellar hook-basal body complex protein [Campylobacterota bacterium]